MPGVSLWLGSQATQVSLIPGKKGEQAKGAVLSGNTLAVLSVVLLRQTEDTMAVLASP